MAFILCYLYGMLQVTRLHRIASAGIGCMLVMLAAPKAWPQTQLNPPDRSTLYMLFLSQQAQDATRRSTGGLGATAEDRAARLHVRPEEIPVLDREALAYAEKDSGIHQEALQYRDACKTAQKPLGRAVVQSFTTRRAALATAAFDNIRSQLAPESYSGLLGFLDSDLPKSFKAHPVR